MSVTRADYIMPPAVQVPELSCWLHKNCCLYKKTKSVILVINIIYYWIWHGQLEDFTYYRVEACFEYLLCTE